jgi:hypothetical protein
MAVRTVRQRIDEKLHAILGADGTCYCNKHCAQYESMRCFAASDVAEQKRFRTIGKTTEIAHTLAFFNVMLRYGVTMEHQIDFPIV